MEALWCNTRMVHHGVECRMCRIKRPVFCMCLGAAIPHLPDGGTAPPPSPPPPAAAWAHCAALATCKVGAAPPETRVKQR